MDASKQPRRRRESGDRFQIRRRLGEGGLGVVYEAIDSERCELVALKTLRQLDSESIYRLKEEFRVLADLHHENLVTLYDLVVDGERCFFSMELIRGVDFVVHTAAEHEPGAMSCDLERLRASLRQLASGVAALHDVGKLHRDLKPSNVLVTEEHRVVILDFGFATDFDRRHASVDQRVVGTAAYMAPEQARADGNLTPAADWYSVGALMYEALTGAPPFEGPFLGVLMQKQTDDPPPPSARVSGVPPEIDELCMRLLSRDPSERPDADAMIASLAGVEASRTRPRLHSEPGRAAAFAGREAELALLDGAVRRSRHDATTVLLEGASGIGKSALIREFFGRLVSDYPDAVALAGRCYWRESLPYRAMDGVVDQLSQVSRSLPRELANAISPTDVTHLLQLFPVLGRVPAIAEQRRQSVRNDPQERRNRAFGALREVFERFAQRFPVIVFLDDLHWVDADTVTLLLDLMRPPEPPPLLLILSRRERGGERESGGQSIARARDAFERALELLPGPLVHIPLGPLPHDVTVEIIADALDREDRELSERIAAEAGGSPLFAWELARHAQNREGDETGPIDLDAVLRARIATLDNGPRALLALVSVAGEPITRRAAADAAALDGAEFARQIQFLASQRLARTAGSRQDDTVEPYHDRIREAAVAHLSPREVERNHREIALALQTWDDGTAEQLARHWKGGSEPDRAGVYAREAAERARAQLDFDRAADLYRLALSLGTKDARDSRELLVGLANALADAGRPEEAAYKFLEAAELEEGGRPNQFELRRRAAECFLMGGYLQPGLEAAQRVLAEVGMSLPGSRARTMTELAIQHVRLMLRPLRVRTRPEAAIAPDELTRIDTCWSIGAGLAMVNPSLGAVFTGRGTLLSLASGEPIRMSRTLFAASAAAAALGWHRQVARLRNATHRIADETGHELPRFYAEISDLATGFLIDCRWRDTLAGCDRALARWRAAGHDRGWEADVIDQFRCWSLMFLGDVRELQRHVSASIREAQRAGNRFHEISFRTCFPQLHIAQDRPDDALADVEDAIASWMPATTELLTQHYWGLVSRSMIALYRGELGALGPSLDQQWATLQRSMMWRVVFLRSEMLWTRGRIRLQMAVEAGARGAYSEHAEHVQIARRCEASLRRQPVPVAPMCASLIAGGIAATTGDPSRAVAALRDSLAAAAALESSPIMASVQRQLGALLGGTEGDEMRARSRAWMTREQVRNPARFGAMVVAGWRHPG